MSTQPRGPNFHGKQVWGATCDRRDRGPRVAANATTINQAAGYLSYLWCNLVHTLRCSVAREPTGGRNR